tara:strand:- start:1022 stop:1630 length:609 start_codon:yes stop_codon:yes gene_type:complete
MEISGVHRISAPRSKVWEALNDSDILKDSIPGCQSIQKVSDTVLNATIVAKIGPVKATFRGTVTLSNINPPHGYTITGNGQGGAVGFGSGRADITLTEEGEDTILSYDASAQVGGKLAQIGQRLIDSTAKSLTDQFFANFSDKITKEASSANTPSVEDTDPIGDTVNSQDDYRTYGRGISTWAWVSGIIALITALLLIYTNY